jgi:hypothetical protein
MSTGCSDMRPGFGHADVARYLLELGAKPNDKFNGGSTALDNCFESFGYESSRSRISSTGFSNTSKATKYCVSNTRTTIQILLEKGGPLAARQRCPSGARATKFVRVRSGRDIGIGGTTCETHGMYSRHDSQPAANTNDEETPDTGGAKARIVGVRHPD